jgi:hypothetical protein
VIWPSPASFDGRLRQYIVGREGKGFSATFLTKELGAGELSLSDDR